MKLNIQLASSLNFIWRSVVALAFLVRLVNLYENFPHYVIALKYITSFTFGNIEGIKFCICYLHVSLSIAVDFMCTTAQVQK